MHYMCIQFPDVTTEALSRYSLNLSASLCLSLQRLHFGTALVLRIERVQYLGICALSKFHTLRVYTTN